MRDGPRLWEVLVVARSYGVEVASGLRFQRNDANVWTAVAKRFRRTLVAIPVVTLSNPLYQTFSTYDGEFGVEQGMGMGFIQPLPAYWGNSPRLADKIGVWIRSVRTLLPQIKRSQRVIVYMPSPLGFLAWLVARLLGRRPVVYYGGDWETGADGGSSDLGDRLAARLRRALESFTYRWAPVLFVRNRHVYAALSRRRQKVFKAGTSSPLLRADPLTRVDTCDQETVRVLSVVSLVSQKGFEDLLKAVAQLRHEGVAIELWQAGNSDTQYRQGVLRLADALGCGDVLRLHGYLNPSNLLELYRSADIFVLPSHNEGFPRALVEAMSQGLPAIATRVGGVSEELTHAEHVLLVEPGDPEALVQAIRRLLDDGALRRHLITTGQAWAVTEARHPDFATQLLALLEDRRVPP